MKKLLLILVIYGFLKGEVRAQGWSELGISSVNSLNANNSISTICVDENDSIYAAGWFTNSKGFYYVSKWNGTNWAELGNTTATALNANNFINTIASDKNGNIYAGGYFTGKSGKYVAKWNGTSWSDMANGNITLASSGEITSICADGFGNVYATGLIQDGWKKYCVIKSDFSYYWYPVASYSSYALNANSYSKVVYVDKFGVIYTAGNFTNTNSKKYVARSTGYSWAELGTTISSALNANGSINTICEDPLSDSIIYAAGSFQNSSAKFYVAKWDGTNWSELGTGTNSLNANGPINSICTDTKGNVYAAGFFTNSAGKFYVAKWDGTKWSELGFGNNSLNANLSISVIVVDSKDNLYAAGQFTNSLGKAYVAKFTASLITESDNSLIPNTFIFYPNPATQILTIKTAGFVQVPQAQILNSLGQEITSLSLTSELSSVDVSAFPKGIYSIKVGTQVQKLMVE